MLRQIMREDRLAIGAAVYWGLRFGFAKKTPKLKKKSMRQEEKALPNFNKEMMDYHMRYLFPNKKQESKS